jgi:hypothetical protein
MFTSAAAVYHQCAQETCCRNKRDRKSHLASAEKREHVKQQELYKSESASYDYLKDVTSPAYRRFSAAC